jgi:sec-independent protein translocase protein TatA
LGRRAEVGLRAPADLFLERSMLGSIGFTELAVIAVICLLLFGAKRIPDVAASIGKGIREFKKGIGSAEPHLEDD